MRQLSCQSSLEPSVPEESPEQEEIEQGPLSVSMSIDQSSPTKQPTNEMIGQSSSGGSGESGDIANSSNNIFDGVCGDTVKRPDSLVLHSTTSGKISENADKSERKQKYLYRSSSTRHYKRQTTHPQQQQQQRHQRKQQANKQKCKLGNEFDQIYFISSNKEDEYYDSIEVIDERRQKNFQKSDSARLYKSNTFICEEYYSSPPLVSSTQVAVEPSPPPSPSA